jgi:ribosome-binding protein aMBF1 (putative translation factor)
MTIAMNCESCGMPLAGAEDHALADATIPYCNHCAPEGRLPAVQERLERFTQWTMRQEGLDYVAAREKAIAYMRTMPAWKDAF